MSIVFEMPEDTEVKPKVVVPKVEVPKKMEPVAAIPKKEPIKASHNLKK